MHEYPYALGIARTAEKYAREEGSSRVLEIRLTLGKASGLMPESLSFYFDLISRGRLCEGAKLTFELVTPLLRCRDCGKLFERRPFCFVCEDESCAGEGEPTEIGREFVIDSILVE